MNSWDGNALLQTIVTGLTLFYYFIADIFASLLTLSSLALE